MADDAEGLVEYDAQENEADKAPDADDDETKKGHYAGINASGKNTYENYPRETLLTYHLSGFTEFLLKAELTRAIVDCGRCSDVCYVVRWWQCTAVKKITVLTRNDL